MSAAQDSRLILESAAIALYAMEPNYDEQRVDIPWSALSKHARHYWRQRVIEISVNDYLPGDAG